MALFFLKKKKDMYKNNNTDDSKQLELLNYNTEVFLKELKSNLEFKELGYVYIYIQRQLNKQNYSFMQHNKYNFEHEYMYEKNFFKICTSLHELYFLKHIAMITKINSRIVNKMDEYLVSIMSSIKNYNLEFVEKDVLSLNYTSLYMKHLCEVYVSSILWLNGFPSTELVNLNGNRYYNISYKKYEVIKIKKIKNDNLITYKYMNYEITKNYRDIILNVSYPLRTQITSASSIRFTNHSNSCFLYDITISFTKTDHISCQLISDLNLNYINEMNDDVKELCLELQYHIDPGCLPRIYML